MQTKLFRSVGGISLMAGAFLLFAYAVLFPSVLPKDKYATAYASLIQSPWWKVLAVIAFFGVVFSMLGFLAVYSRIAEKARLWGLLGFLAVEFAYLLQASKVTWELFIYPILANNERAVFLINDHVLKSDAQFVLFRTVASLSILVGILTFCLSIIRTHIFPSAAGYLVLFGAVLYGIGPLWGFAASIAGIATFSVGCFWLSIALLRATEDPS